MKKGSKIINWKNLSKQELKELSVKLEREATTFDMKLDRFMFNTSKDETKEVKTKLSMLWNVGYTLWSKVRAIELWRYKHGK